MPTRGEEIRAELARRRRERVPDAEARPLIDRLIREHASPGRAFSANDLRPQLRGVREAIIGPRFSAASRKGLIQCVGSVRSTQARTAGHRIPLWQGSATAQQAGLSQRETGEPGTGGAT